MYSLYKGESTDGYSCIRFGMVGWDSDVMDLISLVETVGKQEEESWNFIDTMAEVVKKGILETALYTFLLQVCIFCNYCYISFHRNRNCYFRFTKRK